MRKIILFSITFGLTCLTSVSVCAQGARQTPIPPLEVTIIIQQQQVRFTAPRGAQELRLEVYDQAGELIYDSGVTPGPELAWPLQKTQEQAVASGLYAYRLTVKDATAESPRAQSGYLIVDRGQDRDPQTDRVWVTSQGAGGVGASITGAELTVAASGEATVAGARVLGARRAKGEDAPGANAAVDQKVSGAGTPGQIAKWTATDAIGDSIVTESSEGNVGIGTTAPSQKLQVAGVIHSTTGGIKFPDGTVQTTAIAGGGVTAVTASGPLASSGGATPNISLVGVVPIANGGTGSSTQNFVDLMTGQTIGGNKTFTNAVNTNSQYNINGNRVLAIQGTTNLFAGVGAGANNTSSGNSFFGPNAGSANTTGGGNSFFGNEAGRSNTTGFANAFFGDNAGYSNTEGYLNSFFGKDAGSANNTGIFNSFFGFAAGGNNTSGQHNSFFGSNAGYRNTTGANNAFIGGSAGFFNTTGANNSFLGVGAGQDNTTGAGNTFIGSRAGNNNTTENDNTFIGVFASGVAGITNATAIGANALVTTSDSLVLGNNNVKVGIGVTAPAEKLQVAGVIHSTTGGIRFPDGSIQTTASAGGGVTSVTASGPLASSGGTTPNISLIGVVPIANGGTGASTQNFVDLTTGQTIGGTKTFSSAIIGAITGNAATVTNGVYTTGDQTIGGNKTFTEAVNTNSQYNINGSRVLANPGLDNLFVGMGAGASNTGSLNSFLGSRAGSANITGVFNSFVGAHAGSSNTEGSGNAFFGSEAGRSNTTGGENSFFGLRAGFSNTTGGQNSFFGQSAGFSNTVGINNSFFGVGAGHSTTTGNNNSFFGGFAGNANASGQHNSFFGFTTGSNNTTGEENTFFGSSAGNNNATGARNTFIGTNAGLSNSTENNNTYVGASANGVAGITNATAIGAFASVTQSNSLVLGATNVSVGIGVTAPAAKLDVRSGDVYIGSAGQGVILKSPDGATCRKLTIDNSGVLILTTIACP